MKINPITVTELNKYVKDSIAQDEFLNNVLVKGEISNYKHHYTGHLYFTLKDEKSLIKCVMFKTYADNLNFEPKDGMKIILFGTVSVFERDGIYQIYAKSMQEDGIGDLYAAYEKLKEKLTLEGLFDEKHKKKIPMMPKIIGVLTSNTGAVIRDIINVSTRRNPNVYIRLLPVPVQGVGAAEKIVKAIKRMNDENLADVIILARGGGSLEDLWPFNEEIVARAIFDSKLPVISAVGHETDFTIADFVADLRAPTPSAAAELAVPDIEDVKYDLNLYDRRMRMALKKKTDIMRLRFEKCMNSSSYQDPYQKINDRYLLVDKYVKQLEKLEIKKVKDIRIELTGLISKLDALSPLKTLARGYSLVENEEKRVITKVKDLKVNDKISIRFQDGIANATII